MSNNIQTPAPIRFPSSPRYIPRSPPSSYHTCPTHPRTPPPWVVYHIPFPAMPCRPTSEPSPILPPRSPSMSPAHISLTVNEIELYMLESRVQHNMADCLQDEPLAVESWEHLQFEMRLPKTLKSLSESTDDRSEHSGKDSRLEDTIKCSNTSCNEKGDDGKKLKK